MRVQACVPVCRCPQSYRSASMDVVSQSVLSMFEVFVTGRRQHADMRTQQRQAIKQCTQPLPTHYSKCQSSAIPLPLLGGP